MYRRWYDQEPLCTKMLSNLHEIKQPEVVEFCIKIIDHFAENIRRQIQIKNSSGVTSIGLSGLKHLYNYRREHRRWYDSEPEIQRIVGVLYTLPPEGLISLGFTLGDTIGMINIYAGVCAEIEEEPKTTDLMEITKAAVEDGKEHAMGLLKELVGDDLFDAVYKDEIS